MYNYSALWIRLIWLLVIGLILIFLSLLICRKLKTWERIVAIVLAVSLIILVGGSTLKALINPRVETIVGYYESEFAPASSLSPFERQYVFIHDDDKFFLELDPFSKKRIFNQEFIKGEEYIISYEKNTNLIVAISQRVG